MRGEYQFYPDLFNLIDFCYTFPGYQTKFDSNMTFNVRVLLCLATIAFVTATVQSNTRTFDTRWDSTPIFKQVKGATDLKSSHLDLTPFIQSGDYKAAQLAAQVRLPNDPLNLTSYSGFVETTPGRHMFMWYFPAQNGDKNAPLAIWLQGGPGGSSLFGLFSEMGPYSLGGKDGHTLLDRPESWNKEYGMLFIDNPVGAGFSYPDENNGGPKGYCTNTKQCVADNLYGLITGFYALFPTQLKVPLFITGESYGGHYVPAFAHKVYEQNLQYGQCFTNKDCPKSYCNLAHPGETGMCHGATVPTGKILVPLRGIAVGDGWIDPVNMVGGYPDMMFNFGLADLKQKAVITDYCDRTVAFIKSNNMTAAFDVWDEMLNGDIYPYPNYFHNITGSNDYDNFLRTDAPEGRFKLLLDPNTAAHSCTQLLLARTNFLFSLFFFFYMSSLLMIYISSYRIWIFWFVCFIT